jgi:SAM-dependent methyltransferase
MEGVGKGATLLHLGSGGGSLDFHLKKSFSVTGVDLNKPMAEHAKSVNPEVEYVIGDMRSVRLEKSFDAVLVHDAIAYMTSSWDLRQVYETARAHLRPGGVLVSLPEQLRERFVQHETWCRTIARRKGEVVADFEGIPQKARSKGVIAAVQDADLIVTTTEVKFDPDPSDSTFEAAFVYLIRRKGKLEVKSDVHTMGIFSLEEFLQAARGAGFEVNAIPWGLQGGWEDYPLVVGRRPD